MDDASHGAHAKPDESFHRTHVTETSGDQALDKTDVSGRTFMSCALLPFAVFARFAAMAENFSLESLIEV